VSRSEHGPTGPRLSGGGFGPSQIVSETLPCPQLTLYQVWQTFQSQFGGPGELNGPPGPPPGSSPGHHVYGPDGGAAAAIPAPSPKPARPKAPDASAVTANRETRFMVVPFVKRATVFG
jgi:hypothetical protein